MNKKEIIIPALLILIPILVATFTSPIDWTGVSNNVTLSDPSNGTRIFDFNTSRIFNGTAVTSGSGLTNVSFYHNFNGTWILNQTDTNISTLDHSENQTYTGWDDSSPVGLPQAVIGTNGTEGGFNLAIGAVRIHIGDAAGNDYAEQVNITNFAQTEVLGSADLVGVAAGVEAWANFSIPVQLDANTFYVIQSFNKSTAAFRANRNTTVKADGIVQTNNYTTFYDEADNAGVLEGFSGLTIVAANSSSLDWTFNTSVPYGENYSWGVEGCATDHTCGFSAEGNYTIHRDLFKNSETFTTPITEGTEGRFELNISLSQMFDVQNGSLLYNNTFRTGSKVTEEDNVSLSSTFSIPLIPSGTSQLHNFNWNLTIAFVSNGTLKYINTTEQSQNVTELSIGECGQSSLIFSIINFTLKDEINGSEIAKDTNATTFKGSFTFGLDSETKNQNFTTNNQSVNVNRFDFCTNNETNVIFTDMEAFYTAVDYADSNHYLNNATLRGNDTSLVDLYLLRDSDAVEFFITVENNLVPLVDAIVQISKFFVGDGVYRTVEIDETDASGKISAYLDLNEKYRFTITQNTTVLGIIEKTAICEEAPCEMTLELSDPFANIFSGFDSAFAENVLYNLTFNPADSMVTFDFVDTTGLATSFTLEIMRSSANQSGVLVSNQTVYTSSGQLTYNMSGQTDGDYIARTYIQRSPLKFIDFITFVLAEGAKTLGLISLFVSLLIILAIIFGLSVSAKMLILVVPLALTLTKIMGFIILGNATLIAIWLVALVAFAIIKT